VLAKILELVLAAVTDMVPYAARDAHAARLCQAFETGGDIDAVAEDGAVLDQNIANIDADAKPHPALVRQVGISLVQGLLDGHAQCTASTTLANSARTLSPAVPEISPRPAMMRSSMTVRWVVSVARVASSSWCIMRL
jgi:hypothetical protein